MAHRAVIREQDQLQKQVERLISSQALRGSESLCRLLQYLAKHAIEHPGTSLKEYQIATEVLGKPSNFDPQVDSAIRVQAGRLRMKLAEYYASDGAADQVIVELPKGSYILTHRLRSAESDSAATRMRPEIVTRRTEPTPDGRKWLAGTALGLLLAIVSSAAIWLAFGGTSHPQRSTASETAATPEVFSQFWGSFVKQTEDPWVVFSNAEFVGRPETGMRYFNASRDAHKLVWDHYTGVGEVLAVHSLDQVFGSLHRELRVKRGSLFSLDDAQNNSLIFLGSPSENLSLGEIPSTKEFVFRRMASGPRAGDLAIVNQHPRASEGTEFLASRSDAPLTDDYAVVALIPAPTPSRPVAILAGTTTFGTEAAAEYVSREQTLKELLSRLNVAEDAQAKPFEALLHVHIARGVPIETELVAVRTR